MLCIFHVIVQFHSTSSLFTKCCVYVSPLSLSVTSLEVHFLWVRVLSLAPDYEMTIACTAENPLLTSSYMSCIHLSCTQYCTTHWLPPQSRSRPEDLANTGCMLLFKRHAVM